MSINDNDELIILDFETTGLSPHYSRIIEVGAVLIRNKEIIDEFHTLMNPGTHIPFFITAYTDITNAMVAKEPSPEKVMPELKAFIGRRTILAHNASFDRKFYCAEMERANIEVDNPFLCSLLLSRRLIPDCSNYQLGTIVNHLSINRAFLRSHRALDDVLLTAQVWFHLHTIVKEKTGMKKPDHSLFQKMMKIPKKKIEAYLKNFAEKQEDTLLGSKDL